VDTIYYFTADWCKPCEKVKPIVKELNHEQTTALFQTIDVDDNLDLVNKFGVRSVPTFIFFQEGIEKRRITGAKTKEQLEDFIYGR
jgi:thioredoxin 1